MTDSIAMHKVKSQDTCNGADRIGGAEHATFEDDDAEHINDSHHLMHVPETGPSMAWVNTLIRSS